MVQLVVVAFVVVEAVGVLAAGPVIDGGNDVVVDDDDVVGYVVVVVAVAVGAVGVADAVIAAVATVVV